MSKTKRPALFIAACVAPAAILAAYCLLWPAIQAVWLSFTDASVLGLKSAKFVGFSNYSRMLSDRHFVDALMNTLKLLAAAPIITIVFALLLAFMVTQSKLRERGFYRTVFFFPSIISMTVIGIVWSFIFHPTMGILNMLLTGIGVEGFEAFAWTSTGNTAIWTVAVAYIWQSAGYFMVMHIAAIDGITEDVYEAATIDGAGPVRKLISITLPLIKDIVGITFIFAVSGILDNSFALARIMTPRGRADVLLSYIYTQGYTNSRYGYAMAITTFTLAMAIVLSALSRALSGRESRKVVR